MDSRPFGQPLKTTASHLKPHLLAELAVAAILPTAKRDAHWQLAVAFPANGAAR